MTPMSDGHAMRCTQTTKVVALHTTGKTLTERCARNVNERTRHKMIRRKFDAHIEHIVFADAELDEFELRLNLSPRELATLSARHVLHFGKPCPELNGCIAVLLWRELTDNLHIVELQHGDRYMAPVVHKQTGHSDLFDYHSGTHGPIPHILGKSARSA